MLPEAPKRRHWQVKDMELRSLQERGVTLIELMIVGVIIGLVAGMAVPRFQTAYEQMQIKAADRELTSTIRLARSNAITQKNPFGLYFDETSISVTLFEDIANVGAGTFETGDSAIRVLTLPQEFDYLSTDCTNDVIVFRSNGSALFGGGGNIYTMAFLDQFVSMTANNVLASTGRVSTDTHTY